MLQQILNDMFIDPELLAELDEEQKQVLFCKMREEQVRKWREREQNTKTSPQRKRGGKKVSFLTGKQDEPLVEVLGENEDVDTLLRERAKRQAEMEGEAMRKAAEEELDKLVNFSQSTVRAMEQSANNRTQKSPVADLTREAVVKSLHEATSEMENKIRSLELHENKSEEIPVVANIPNTSFLVGQTEPKLSTTRALVTNENIPPKPSIVVQPYKDARFTKMPLGVAAQIEQFERLTDSSIEALKTATLERAKKRRQKEILDCLRNQAEAAKEQVASIVQMSSEKEEVAWQEQERKAKEAEKNIREIARRARFEHRRSSSSSSLSEALKVNEDINGNLDAPTVDIKTTERKTIRRTLPDLPDVRQEVVRPKLRSVRPLNRDSIIEWFKEEELPKGIGLNEERTCMQPWFHGAISRLEAERHLKRMEVGSFLVRVSERIWGYAVSYRAYDRCRHYLIDAVGGKYAFLGSYQTTHSSLNELIKYHKKECITVAGNEILNSPCKQDDPSRPDYLELLIGTKYFTLIQCAM